jgi:hypothetical protein
MWIRKNVSCFVFCEMHPAEITSRKSIHYGIEGRLNSGNACYQSAQKDFAFIYTSYRTNRKVKISLCWNVVLPII